jgi:hypothetical protein
MHSLHQNCMKFPLIEQNLECELVYLITYTDFATDIMTEIISSHKTRTITLNIVSQK